MRQPVNDVVDAQFVGFVGVVDWPESGAGPFPELRDVGVVVDDHLQPLGRIVVFEHAAKNGAALIVELRDDVEGVDFEEGMKNRMRRFEVHELRLREGVPDGYPHL